LHCRCKLRKRNPSAMNRSADTGRFDFRRSPYRGIVSEVARDLGISQPSATGRIKRREPKIMELIITKMRERERAAKRMERRFEAAMRGAA
jgi:hypothetical protein